MLSKIILAGALILMISHATAAYYVNETVGDFRISFEGKDDTNLVAKAWNLSQPGGIFEIPPNESILDIKDSLMVLAGDFGNISEIYSGVMVIAMNKPINISEAEMEFFKNSSKPYIRIFDRTIDGHKGIYGLAGDGPDDPDMDRIGFYWLDEAEDGTATELVAVVSNEVEAVSETVINTVHVEKTAMH